MKHLAPQTNRQPIKVLWTVINLHRNGLMDIQRPTWWTNQGRLSEISFLNAFGDKERTQFIPPDITLKTTAIVL